MMRRRNWLAGVAAAAMATPARASAAPGVSILTYHRFDPLHATAATVVSQARFEAQMASLAARGTPVLRLADAVAALVKDGPGPDAQSLAITADDGFRSVYTGLFPVLRRYRFPATLFINPPMIGRGGAYLTWAQIEEMRASGLVDIQAHTLTHPNFHDQQARRTQGDFAAFVAHELDGSARLIADRLGIAVPYLAWPYGISSPALEAAASQAGFTAAFALGGRAAMQGDNPFALPRYQVYETDTEVRFNAIMRGQPRRLIR